MVALYQIENQFMPGEIKHQLDNSSTWEMLGVKSKLSIWFFSEGLLKGA